jgi:oxygen-dependent protoporphyrinogen oxidase
LHAIVTRELAELLGFQGQPLLDRIVRWPRTMPQYCLGHLDTVARIEQIARQTPGLHLAGNAYRGVGIPQCVRSGQTAATQIVELLDHQATHPTTRS